MPEGTCLVLVMLVNYRNIIILDEKVMEAKGWELSNPCGLQHMPLGRAHQLWLFKRKKGGNTKRETQEKWLSYLGNQGGGVCSLELIYFVCSSPKLVTQLLMEGVCTDSHGHLHRKAKWELLPCPPHINLYKGNYYRLMQGLLSICDFAVRFLAGKV